MAKTSVEKELVEKLLPLASRIIQVPIKKAQLDYDEEADVLYISFKRPQKATDTKELKDGILVRYRGDEIVGITILEASKR